MKNTWKTVLAYTGFGALGALAGWMAGKKNGLAEGERKGLETGRKEGAKSRENEILTDCVYYVPISRLDEFAQSMLEDEDVTEDYPLLVFRSDKYDYTNGVDLKK